MKNIIRINESDLQRMVENSVRRALKEGTINEYGFRDGMKDLGKFGLAAGIGTAAMATDNPLSRGIDRQFDRQEQMGRAFPEDTEEMKERDYMDNLHNQGYEGNTISWEKANQFEGKMNRAITESIRNFINELSSDTRDEARQKAQKKYVAYSSKYGPNSPRTQHAKDQFNNFANSVDSEYYKANTAKKARMDKNKEDRRNGKRTYVSGKGWRTNQNEN